MKPFDWEQSAFLGYMVEQHEKQKYQYDWTSEDKETDDDDDDEEEESNLHWWE